MSFHPKKGFKLVTIVSFIIIVSIMLTMLISIHSSYSISRQSLVNNYLSGNYDRAMDLSAATGDLLVRIQNSVNSMAEIWQRNERIDPALLNDLYATHREYFESLTIVRKDKVLMEIASSNKKQLQIGTNVDGPIVRTLIKLREPQMTEPFIGKTGNLLILVTSPLFDKNNDYYGYIAGTIYLHDSNILQLILQQKYESNGSYVFAVDSKGNVIFHPDPNMIGKNFASNEVVWKLMAGLNGSMEYTDNDGKSFYAGYAYNMNSGWGIVSQTPADVVNAPLNDLLESSILQSLPLLLITLAAGWLLTYLVVRPLHMLAEYSNRMLKEWSADDMPPIRSATYEIKLLYSTLRVTARQMQKYIRKLRNETALDGLTGLANRRNFDATLEAWCLAEEPFALIMLDIDHFKRVNDTYGHLVGDQVIQHLAATMRNVSREGDLCFRYGGEELGILVRGANSGRAYLLAERLRQTVNAMPSPSGQCITISLGIAVFPEHGSSAEELIVKADAALYTSKHEGRDRTTIYAQQAVTTVPE
ncbi:diguanylate cyclase [Paenibacillus campi]|uniref:sensor domain-containing diguanylate cyclase n=1 Tax=Paenibacillus campi TaxID=3106031 RepID=UPI002AFF6779|nr:MULTISPECIES: diguanylate cyclase [unclassified Paenibacillus]